MLLAARIGSSLARPGLVLAVSLVALQAAQAALIEAPSRADAVTLYPDAAIVRREAIVELPAGSHEILIGDLPATLDPASFRVEGAGESRATIAGVDLETRAARPEGVSPETRRRLLALRAEQARIGDRIDAVEGRKAMILRYGQGEGGKEGRLPEIGDWARAWEAVGKGLQGANDELRALRDDLARVEAEIATLEQPAILPRPNSAEQRKVARIAIEAAGAGRMTLVVSYRVQGAGWRPIYDARLDTRGQGPTLELARRAMIRQTTGEDWSEVALTLSTLQVSRATATPLLRGERIAFYEPPPPRPYATTMAPAAPAMRAPAADGAAESRAAKAAAEPAPVQAEEASARLESSAYQSEFVVPGRVSLPSGPQEKSVRLGADKPEITLTVRAAPVLDPKAYLEASFTAPGEAPILAGEVLLARDGAFIGRGRLPFIAPGDQARLGFGADDGVRIARVPVGRRARDPGFLGSTRSDDFRFKTTVKNLHAFPVQIRIEDRVPVSEDQAITIERLPDMTKPDFESPEDRRGVLGWNPTLKPQEERSLVTAYRIRWPAGRETRVSPLAP